MARSAATTVDQYLNELPSDRRAVISTVRDVVCRNLPEGYRERVNWGMISYEVPLERYPHTYNGQPLSYAALAAQKNYFALYLTGVYQDAPLAERLKIEFDKAGKKLNMGKSCVRFKKLDDLLLNVIGKVIAATSPERLIATYEQRRHAAKS
ncbi:MAG: DUF1801 domain-containing protein [Gemmatimonadaceae bacterium]